MGDETKTATHDSDASTNEPIDLLSLPLSDVLLVRKCVRIAAEARQCYRLA